MGHEEVDTKVFVIRKDKITGKHRCFTEKTGPESCLDLPGEAFLENKSDSVSPAIILDYLNEHDDFKLKSKWTHDKKLWTFYHSGQGKGAFYFTAKDFLLAFDQLMLEDDEVTNVLLELSVHSFQDGLILKIPFWCDLQDFISKSENSFFECNASLFIKEDGVNNLGKDYPWSFFVLLSYDSLSKSGIMQIIDHEKKD